MQREDNIIRIYAEKEKKLMIDTKTKDKTKPPKNHVTPHDWFTKESLSDPIAMRELIEKYLSEEDVVGMNFKTLKSEEVYLYRYETMVDVLRRIPFFIQEVYNKKRLHSSLGYLPPIEFEANLNPNLASSPTS